MKATATITSHTSRNPAETLTIRMAVSADAEALARLAQLDSAPPPAPVPMLVAEVDGELRAALPLHGGPAIADPFRRTVELVAILAERTRKLAPPPRRSALRWRLPRAPRPAPAPAHRRWAASSHHG
jgi:hypothetical protein